MHGSIGLSASIDDQTWEINDIFKTSGQYDTATTNHDRNTNPNPNLKHFCTKNARFATTAK